MSRTKKRRRVSELVIKFNELSMRLDTIEHCQLERKMQVVKEVISQDMLGTITKEMISPITKSYDDLKELITGMETRLNTKIDENVKSTVVEKNEPIQVTVNETIPAVLKDGRRDPDHFNFGDMDQELIDKVLKDHERMKKEQQEIRAEYGWNQ